ncbi:alpha/beta family hydrolase [Bowmanella denitrificans]|uniref:alpha/beta family hydrolase n=1 Tax=Bowmanella denitrificans TaxID=366582 RepID=UPI000C9B9595|nr:alpha/beta family hydrolase [Bowmanella denitrificans]
MILADTAHQPIASLLLAHGAGAGMHSDFMQQVAAGLCELGVNVYRFNFPYMQLAEQQGKKRPPDGMAKLQSAMQDALAQVPVNLPRFIGGKSMGGRVASMLADSLEVQGCLCLGYPFHPPGKPEKLRIDHLQKPGKPILIVQGQRDPFGREEEIAGYSLHSRVQVAKITDGDHSFVPRKSSGLVFEDNLHTACQQMVAFIGANK